MYKEHAWYILLVFCFVLACYNLLYDI